MLSWNLMLSPSLPHFLPLLSLSPSPSPSPSRLNRLNLAYLETFILIFQTFGRGLNQQG